MVSMYQINRPICDEICGVKGIAWEQNEVPCDGLTLSWECLAVNPLGTMCKVADGRY